MSTRRVGSGRRGGVRGLLAWGGVWGMAWWACGGVALGQTTGSLRGQVTDETGVPLAGVMVVVEGGEQGVGGRGAVTDEAGGFVVPSLPSGRGYVVRASLTGY